MKYPAEFLEKIKNHLPLEWEKLVAALDEKPSLSIRLNTPKNPTVDFPDIEPISWSENGRYLAQRPYFAHDPHWHAGGYYVQDASSMFLEQFAKPFLAKIDQPIVLDMCAAPGGKSTHLLSLLDGKGLLVANEIIANRNAVLRENLIKWGYANFIVTQSESRYLRSMQSMFDLIVVDAPCSGEGMFRKDANAITEWSEKNVANCVERQSEILDNLIGCLKPGGMLIYSTCTFEEAENMEQINRLQTQYDLEPVALENDPKNWGVTALHTNDSVGYGFYPHKTRGEGFFIAAVRKKGELKNNTSPKNPPHTGPNEWVNLTENLVLEKKADELRLVSSIFQKNSPTLRQYFKIKSVGIAVGNWKGTNFIPSSELAFSQSVANTVPRIAIDRNTAVRFLKCENIHFPDYEKGWHLVTFEGLGLGWVKVMDTRSNNYFPSNWRILK